jgi:hypothetical protein
MEYQIISIQGPLVKDFSPETDVLEAAVTEGIAKGWVPLGPVSIAVFPAGFIFAQTMIRTPSGVK